MYMEYFSCGSNISVIRIFFGYLVVVLLLRIENSPKNGYVMKRFIVLVGLFLSGLQVTTRVGNAQMVVNIVNMDEVLKAKPIDEVQFTVQYEATLVVDTLHPERAKVETVILNAGNKCSVYYSYAKFLTDSVLEVDKATGASREAINEHLNQYSSSINYQIYKNYPAGKVTTLEALAASRFRCEEDNERPEWVLQADTTTILSYPCRKATCHFKGRDYEVWFTPEIARSEGPWKLHGLPGLILRATDSRHHYSFECTGIRQAKKEQPILFGNIGYEPINRRNLNHVYKRFAADPAGYIALTAPHVKINFTGTDGKPGKKPKNMPFNPIELEEK